MRRTRASFLWTALACLLSLSVAVPAAATDAGAPPAEETAQAPSAGPDDTDQGPTPPEAQDTEDPEHSSDPSEPVFLTRRSGAITGYFDLNQRSRPVAPGLEHTSFDRYDGRGWVRVNVLTADLSTPGLRLDYAAPGKVSSTGPLSAALARDNAVAGVNGDFFDIGDTGAPLGVGVDRQRGLIHGSRSGWNNTFMLEGGNVARIAQAYLEASVVRPGKPAIAVTNLNAPQLQPGGIGIYTSDWGSTSRLRVLPSSAPRREVVIRGGQVRANRKSVSSGPIPAGVVHLVGIGEGAETLARLKVGQRAAVRYGLNRDAVRVAVSGSVIVLRDGKVLAPNDIEMHPRTAVGIDRDQNRIIFVTVDGRQPHSRGMTMKETGVLLKRLGAEDGLNLDGGGSSTMLARESGEYIGVVNSPSDGRQRSVPNGLGFSFAKGSGKLRGFRIEPAAETTESHEVLRGLSRVLVARGHDETFAPVAAKPRWSGSPQVEARPGPAARTVVTGRRTGDGRVTASTAAASGQFRIRVLGRVHRLEASVPSLALAGTGSRATFEVRGYDADGFGTWVEPRDIRLSFDRDELGVRRTGRGFTVVARAGSASELVKVTAGGRSTYVGVTVGLARKPVDRMNGPAGWEASAYPARASASLAQTKDRHGNPGRAIAMRYALYGKKATRAAYLTAAPARDLPGRARRIGLWVRGDGRGAWLRLVVRDAAGTRATLNLSQRVTWTGWRFVSADLTSSLTQPLDFVRVYAVETTRSRRYSGTLAFDDLTVFTERPAPSAATAPLRDPAVADLAPLAEGGLRIAVLADAGISASAPASTAVDRTRRTMRQIVAANPDLVVLGGDLTRKGDRPDLALAARLAEEEIGPGTAWRYVPGEGELGSSGDLSAFRERFGEPVRVVDRDGTRLVFLNSAQGIFRLGGFGQLLRLRAQLNDAATDPGVSSVVVFAHHPTSDPAPGGRAELADPREADVVEGLLADFRARSGKAVAYVGAHARRFEMTRTDGVQQVVAGPVTGAARSTIGSFTGWSLLRVAPDGVTAAFHPLVDRLRLRAPESMAVGATAQASGMVRQAGRRVSVAYPMHAEWLPSPRVHVGAAAGAPPTAVLAVAPQTGKVTALRAGSGELRLRVGGVVASRTVAVR